jgi:hypothetical protein
MKVKYSKPTRTGITTHLQPFAAISITPHCMSAMPASMPCTYNRQHILLGRTQNNANLCYSSLYIFSSHDAMAKSNIALRETR